MSRRNGLRMVRVDQAFYGVPVFQSDSRFLLDREGRLVRTVGTLVPGAARVATPAPTISAAAALVTPCSRSASSSHPASHATPQGPALSDKTELRVANPRQVADPVGSQLVYFPLAPGVLALA